ncbi:MAG: oligoendopeptidase F [Firmicutes bacterium]|nr:oligoendopeptidase F [Bacillota bacterium]
MKKVLQRKDVSSHLKWDMGKQFAGAGEIEACFARIREAADALKAYDGKLTSKTDILEFLTKKTEVDKPLEYLYTVLSALRDENTADTAAQALAQRAESLYYEYAGALSFAAPQLCKLDESELAAYAADPDFSDYSAYFSELLREKPHILSDGEEKLLSMAAEVGASFDNIFSMLDNIEVPLPVLTVRGERVKLTHGRYSLFLQDQDEAARKAAFKGMYGAFRKLINTISANYYGNVKNYIFFARARKYADTLESFLGGEGIPAGVYEKLVETVSASLPVLHDYVTARKSILNKELHMYDMYVPLVKDADIKLEYPDACAVVRDALKPLGAEYAGLLDKAFSGGWIDVAETASKRSGAYCTHAYTLPHPYVLLNYQKTTHDVFTIAHELGHAMHSHFSTNAQPFPKASYRIFVAEVASTVNEVLLLNHLIKTSDNPDTRRYLISYYLDMFRTTLFRQTMFAEFETRAHKLAEGGTPLTKDALCDLYYGLNQKFYGPDVIHDDLIRYEWARIPHFYYGFYVYKYATGLTAAVNIASGILAGEPGALENYFKFLSAGCSDTPYQILKAAGVDLMTDKPYTIAMRVFAEKVKELREVR